MFLYLLLTILVGVALSAQGPTNSALSKFVGNFQATTISFTGGELAIFAAMLIFGTGDLGRIGEASWWMVLGGLYGAFNVLMTTFAVPVLGLAFSVMIMMLGDLTMSMVIDGFGILEVAKAEISPLRVMGCIVVFLGILCVYLGKREKNNDNNAFQKNPAVFVIMVVLLFVSGMGIPVQSATNAALSKVVGSFESSFVSFTGGLLSIFIITMICNKGKMKPVRHVGIKPWMIIGGFYGVYAVFVKMSATPVLGTALLSATVMTGQLAGGMLVDCTGIFRTKRIRMGLFRILGILFTGAGVALVTWSKLG